MNIPTDEELRKKYDKLYKKFVKGNFSEVIEESNKVLKKRKHQLFFNLLSSFRLTFFLAFTYFSICGL